MMTTQLWKNLRAGACKKLALHLGISLWIMLCYFPPQVWPVREPTAMASSFLPFYPGWSVIYQSVFLLHTAAIWCVPSARASLHYVREVSLAFAMAAVVFWIWPTHVIRPDDAPWFYEWLIVRVDGPGNAFPSMHAAMGLLGVLHLGAAWPRARPALFIWLGFMLVSTLLTRQHVWKDLIAGLVLALTIHLLNKHRRP